MSYSHKEERTASPYLRPEAARHAGRSSREHSPSTLRDQSGLSNTRYAFRPPSDQARLNRPWPDPSSAGNAANTRRRVNSVELAEEKMPRSSRGEQPSRPSSSEVDGPIGFLDQFPVLINSNEPLSEIRSIFDSRRRSVVQDPFGPSSSTSENSSVVDDHAPRGKPKRPVLQTPTVNTTKGTEDEIPDSPMTARRLPAPYAFTRTSSAAENANLNMAAAFRDPRVKHQDRELRDSVRQMLGDQRPKSSLGFRETDSSSNSNSNSSRMNTADASHRHSGRFASAQSSPLATPTKRLSGADYFVSGLRHAEHHSQPPSPRRSTHDFPPSPPRSPRRTSPHRAPPSKPSSKSNSRSSSPVHSMSPLTPLAGSRRSSTFPTALNVDSSRPANPGATQMSPADGKARSLSTAISSQPPRKNPVPYPMDDMILMPSEEDHRYKPRAADAHGLPVESMERPKATTEILLTAPTGKSVERGSRAVLWPTKLSLCPLTSSRTQPNEWFHLDGITTFTICSGCFNSNFPPQAVEHQFRKMSSAQGEPTSKCAFNDPWTRISWLVMVNEGQKDVQKLIDFAQACQSESPCTGSEIHNQHWYTVRDPQGKPISGIDVCPADVKKVSSIMTTLKGLFVPNPAGVAKRRCCMRADGIRFPTFLDLLSEIHLLAYRTGSKADVLPFVNFARLKASIRECTRDKSRGDELWHISSQMPDFIVCEDCYTSIVWPMVNQGSKVAKMLDQTPAKLREDGHRHGTVGGMTCQLYGQRMRAAFYDAVQNDDWRLVAEYARDRRAAERRLRRLKEFSLNAAGRDRQLESDLSQAEKIWKGWQ